MKKTSESVAFDSLFESRAAANERQPDGFPHRFAPTLGVHIYGDLTLQTRLSAAQTTQQAEKYLQLIQDFSTIVDKCGHGVGIRILEAQGERIHLFFESPSFDQECFGFLVAFSISLTKTVYDHFNRVASDDFRGFKMAADFGESIFLTSEIGGSSFISLSPAANAPAKQLNFGVTTGHLALRTELLKKLFSGWSTNIWTELNVLNPNAWVKRFYQEEINETVEAAANEMLANQAAPSKTVMFATRAEFVSPGMASIEAPLRTQGIYLRADLDGFSRSVSQAFFQGQQAVSALVERFVEILEFPRGLVTALDRPVIDMPWEGDCANLILLPRADESIIDLRKFLQVRAALAWHLLDDSKWRGHLGEAKWVLGLACGNATEGFDSQLLVANIQASGRTARIAAGWGAKRSLDAYQAEGVVGCDTVIPGIDYDGLDCLYQRGFLKHQGKNLYVGSIDRLKAADAERKAATAKASAVPFVAASTIYVPPARPYAF